MNIISAEYARCAGLGNKLFPWARAKLFAEQHGCKMLQTRWFSPHGGAITRGGINYKYALTKIWLLGNFKKDCTEMSLREFYCTHRNLPRCFVNSLKDVDTTMDQQHIVFRWNTEHNFSDLNGKQKFLLKKLSDITMPSQLQFAQQYEGRDFIALNVRTGKDFVSRSSGRHGYYLTEIEWFVNALAEARRRYGHLRAVIVSDGGRSQLAELLKEPDVELLEAPTAIADLLVLSKATVLLGSGNSTFSAWASYLGEMDTFSSAETPFLHFKLGDGRSGTQIVSTLS